MNIKYDSNKSFIITWNLSHLLKEGKKISNRDYQNLINKYYIYMIINKK